MIKINPDEEETNIVYNKNLAKHYNHDVFDRKLQPHQEQMSDFDLNDYFYFNHTNLLRKQFESNKKAKLLSHEHSADSQHFNHHNHVEPQLKKDSSSKQNHLHVPIGQIKQEINSISNQQNDQNNPLHQFYTNMQNLNHLLTGHSSNSTATQNFLLNNQNSHYTNHLNQILKTRSSLYADSYENNHAQQHLQLEMQQKLHNYFLYLLNNGHHHNLGNNNSHQHHLHHQNPMHNQHNGNVNLSNKSSVEESLEKRLHSNAEYILAQQIYQQQQNSMVSKSTHNLEYLRYLSRSYPELLNYYNYNQLALVDHYAKTINHLKRQESDCKNCNCCSNEPINYSNSTSEYNETNSENSNQSTTCKKNWPSFVPYKKRYFPTNPDEMPSKMQSSSSVCSSSPSSSSNLAEPVNDPEVKQSSSTKPQDTNSKSSPKQENKSPKKEVLPNQPKKIKRCPHVWQFCADLLENENFNPSIIKWLNKDKGIFKIVKPDKVAELWGAQKNRKSDKKMNYEKMARGMRYSRREGFFKKLDKEKNKPNEYGKQLVFQFSDKVVKNFEWKWSFST